MIAAMLLMLAEAPATDTKAPYRIAIERLALTGDATEAASCAARSMSRNFRVTNYPLPDGTGLDFAVAPLLNLSSGNPSYLGYQFHKTDAGSYLTVVYRHPFSAKTGIGVTRNTAKTCFPDDWNTWATENGQQLIKKEAR